MPAGLLRPELGGVADDAGTDRETQAETVVAGGGVDPDVDLQRARRSEGHHHLDVDRDEVARPLATMVVQPGGDEQTPVHHQVALAGHRTPSSMPGHLTVTDPGRVVQEVTVVGIAAVAVVDEVQQTRPSPAAPSAPWSARRR